MGLTIHYGLTSRTRSAAKAEALVERMRQLALDLPFESVDDHIQHLGPDVCQRPLDDLRGDDQLFSAVLDGCQHVQIPWHRKQHGSIMVQPLEIVSFWTVPGPGSEWASFGLARYPTDVDVTYRPSDDDRFTKTIKQRGMTRWEFDWKRWRDWLQHSGHDRWDDPQDEKFQEQRKVKTRLGSTWRYSTFCKTQYASDERCGGIPTSDSKHDDLLDGLKGLGLVNVTGEQVSQAVKELFPMGEQATDQGEVLRAVFLHLRRQNTKDNVGR